MVDDMTESLPTYQAKVEANFTISELRSILFSTSQSGFISRMRLPSPSDRERSRTTDGMIEPRDGETGSTLSNESVE